MMATKSTSNEEYYDIMIFGHTGIGKSTTSDKLIIANPDRIPTRSIAFGSLIEKIVYEDIALWMTREENLSAESPELDVDLHLKNLVEARSTPKPQVAINKIRTEKTREYSTDCEIFSNETTKVRVIDVPGFFDKDSQSQKQRSVIYRKELTIMRTIIQAQTKNDLKVKKILYFLPIRGALERSGAVVQSELKILTHYFGKELLQKLVLVATNQSRFSLNPDFGDDFPDVEREKTLSNFKKSLIILNLFSKEADIPTIPIICISLIETCESILQKVKDAPVVNNKEFQLEFDPGVCLTCGIKVSNCDGRKTVSYMSQSEETAYEESCCHPLFIPHKGLHHKLTDQLVRFVSLGRVQSASKHIFSVKEVCIKCNQEPGSRACMNVGQEIQYRDQTIVCDHNFTI